MRHWQYVLLLNVTLVQFSLKLQSGLIYQILNTLIAEIFQSLIP